MKNKIFIMCGIVIVVILISVFTILSETDEELNPALAFQVNENTDFGCVELSRDGIIYRPFGIIGGKSSLRQAKIGVRGDESQSSIYSVKGFDSSEWIIETDEGFMTVGDMLYKAINVQEIPKEFEKYKEYNFDEDNSEGNMTNQNESFRIDIEIGSQTFIHDDINGEFDKKCIRRIYTI